METAKRMAQALLGFGASIEALEPPGLRAAILALASEAIAAYGIGPSRP